MNTTTTPATDIALLMDRWSKVAPEECSKRLTDNPGIWWFELNDDLGGSSVSPFSLSARPNPAVILYHALTCAARRGWTPELRDSGRAPLKNWEALVATDHIPLPYVARERTPEIAVLSAYVSALEASVS